MILEFIGVDAGYRGKLTRSFVVKLAPLKRHVKEIWLSYWLLVPALFFVLAQKMM